MILDPSTEFVDENKKSISCLYGEKVLLRKRTLKKKHRKLNLNIELQFEQEFTNKDYLERGLFSKLQEIH